MLGPTLESQDLYFLNFVTCKKLIHFFNFQFAKFSGEAEQLREVANNQQPQIIDLDSDWGGLKAQKYDTFPTQVEQLSTDFYQEIREQGVNKSMPQLGIQGSTILEPRNPRFWIYPNWAMQSY